MIEVDKPPRQKERIEHVLPSCTASITETLEREPNLAAPKTLIPEPPLTKERILKLEPSEVASKIDSADPRRPKLRTDKDDPIDRNSRAEQREPDLEYIRILSEEPNCTKFKALILLHKRATERSDKLLPILLKSSIDNCFPMRPLFPSLAASAIFPTDKLCPSRIRPLKEREDDMVAKFSKLIEDPMRVKLLKLKPLPRLLQSTTEIAETEPTL
jgi:hypothetical protein